PTTRPDPAPSGFRGLWPRGRRRCRSRAPRPLLHPTAVRARAARGAARWEDRLLAEGAAPGAHPSHHDAAGAHGPVGGADPSAADPAGALPRRVRLALVVAPAGDAKTAAGGEAEAVRRGA